MGVEIRLKFELEGCANGGGEEEEDEPERERGNVMKWGGGVESGKRKKKGGSRAMTKIPSLTLLFVLSLVIFDTANLLHNPN